MGPRKLSQPLSSDHRQRSLICESKRFGRCMNNPRSRVLLLVAFSWPLAYKETEACHIRALVPPSKSFHDQYDRTFDTYLWFWSPL